MKLVLRSSLLLLTLLVPVMSAAADPESSSLGEISIPQPPKPADATQCVEPVDVMRRDHMKFLMHQRDDTVIDGIRTPKYSLVGCIDCHNPASGEQVVRYEDPEHFCAGCHLYTSVKIDCFECHADRGLSSTQQSQNTLSSATFDALLQQQQENHAD
jgi:hypothetical protein